jgi:(E)-4-hydroxy-3-methylbut-2-enyl-diphosphate synthase
LPLPKKSSGACMICPRPFTVAVMGCVVNGRAKRARPMSAWPAARVRRCCFAKGEVVRKVAESEMVEALIAEVHALLNEQGRQDH